MLGDIAAMAAVVTGLKDTKELATSIASLTADTRVADKLNQLVHQVSDVQGTLLETQLKFSELVQDKANLQEQLRAQRDEIEQLKATRKRMDEYEQVEVSPHSFLYRRKERASGQSAPYACPSCFEKGKIRTLQLHQDNLRYYALFCPDCEKRFNGAENPHYEERRTKYLPDVNWTVKKVQPRKP